MLRNLKVLTRVSLNDAEREFIKRQRNLILSSDGDNTHEDKDGGIRTLKYKKPDEKLLREYLMQYKGKELNIKERRLIGGIKSKQLAL